MLGWQRLTLAEIPKDPGTMTAMAAGGLALGAVGSGISAYGTLASGSAAEQAGEMAATAARNSGAITSAAQEEGGIIAQNQAEFQAQQLDQNASTTRAQSQRQAFDINQQTRLALSTLQARSAGSGLSGGGATPVAVASSIGGRGAYLSLTAMANGENVARGEEDQARGARLTGEAAKYGADLSALATRYGSEAEAEADLFKGSSAKTASEFGAAGTLASGLGNAFANYGKVMYPTTTGRAGA